MKIRIGNTNYLINGTCLVNRPNVSELRTELEIHGAEAFAASKKLGPFVSCVLFELLEVGAVIWNQHAGHYLIFDLMPTFIHRLEYSEPDVNRGHPGVLCPYESCIYPFDSITPLTIFL